MVVGEVEGDEFTFGRLEREWVTLHIRYIRHFLIEVDLVGINWLLAKWGGVCNFKNIVIRINK